MDPYMQSFVIAAIDISIEQEKKEAAKIKQGSRR